MRCWTQFSLAPNAAKGELLFRRNRDGGLRSVCLIMLMGCFPVDDTVYLHFTLHIRATLLNLLLKQEPSVSYSVRGGYPLSCWERVPPILSGGIPLILDLQAGLRTGLWTGPVTGLWAPPPPQTGPGTGSGTGPGGTSLWTDTCENIISRTTYAGSNWSQKSLSV